MAQFKDLPPELITMVANALEAETNPAAIHDLATFCRINRACYEAGNILLYKASVRHDQRCLWWAADNGSFGTLNYALIAGASPNTRKTFEVDSAELQTTHLASRGSFGSTSPPGPSPAQSDVSGPFTMATAEPLHLAALAGREDLVTKLLDAGAQIEAPATGLCNCAWMQNHVLDGNKVDQHTLEAYAREPRAVSHTWSPLHLAVCHKKPGTVRLLLSRGAPPRIYTIRIPGDPQQKPYESAGALHFAAATGQMGLVGFILDRGYESLVDVPDQHGYTPLHYAVANGQWSDLPFLISKGANVDRPSKYYDGTVGALSDQPGQHSVLYHACASGRYAEALELIRLGANVQACGQRSKRNLLHLAAMRYSKMLAFRAFGKSPILPPETIGDRDTLISTLLRLGVKFDVLDGKGMLPLQYAARSHLSGAIKLLLRAGADPNAEQYDTEFSTLHGINRTGRFYSPLFLACMTGNDWNNSLRAYHIHLSHGEVDPSEEFLESVETLVNHGADPTAVIITHRQKLKACEKLMELGVDPNNGREPVVFNWLQSVSFRYMPLTHTDALNLPRLILQRSESMSDETFVQSIKKMMTTPWKAHRSPPIDFLYEMAAKIGVSIPDHLCDIISSDGFQVSLGASLLSHLNPAQWAIHGPRLLILTAERGCPKMMAQALDGCGPAVDRNTALEAATKLKTGGEIIELLMRRGEPTGRWTALPGLVEESIRVMDPSSSSHNAYSKRRVRQLENNCNTKQPSYAEFGGDSDGARELKKLLSTIEPSQCYSHLIRRCNNEDMRNCLGASHLETAVTMLRFSPRTDIIQAILENGVGPVTVFSPANETALEYFLGMLDRQAGEKHRPVWLASLAYAPERLTDIIKLLWTKDIDEEHKGVVALRTLILVKYGGPDWRLQAVRKVIREAMGVASGDNTLTVSTIMGWYDNLEATNLP